MTSPSIFIVEDELIVAEDIRQTLINLGYTVAGHAKSGELAIEKVKETKPDLVLMDIHLAGKIDGIETAGRIRSLYDIPVIYLTAHADTALLERAKITEPYGYVLKPYDERELHSVIEMALYKHAAERALHQSEETKRVLVNATQDILFLLDTDGKFLVVNEALAKKAAKRSADLEGSDVFDLVSKGIISPKMACWHLNPAGKKHIYFEEEFGGNWYSISIYPVYDRSGRPAGNAVYIRDITDKIKNDEQIQQNQQYFRSLIEDASDIIVILNRDGTFYQQSTSLIQILGYPPSHSFKQDTIFHLMQPEDEKVPKQIFAEILKCHGTVKPIRWKFIKKDGSSCIVRGILSNFLSSEGIQGIVLNGWGDTV